MPYDSDLINKINGTTSSDNSSTTSTSKTKGYDFMKVLLAEMKYQDPTQPMSSTETTTQMVQINMLNAITSMQSTMEDLASSSKAAGAMSLIGKTVTGYLDDGTEVSGVVKSVSVNGSDFELQVGDDYTVKLDYVSEVSSE